jgi:rhodanese-related sulfurtransferase
MTTTNTLTKTATPETTKAVEYFEAKNAFTTGPVEVSYMLKEKRNDINIVDVRAAEDYVKGHVPGAVNIPQDKWDSLNGLNKDKTNIIYCYTQTCHLGSKAAAKFAGKGYPVMEMEGGFETWKQKGFEIRS